MNVVDVQCEIVSTLWGLLGSAGNPPACLRTDLDPLVAADFNCDGQVNVTDIQGLVTLTLGIPLSATVDANGDDCPDTCQGP